MDPEINTKLYDPAQRYGVPVPLSALAQEGATDGQSIIWSNSLNQYVPGTPAASLPSLQDGYVWIGNGSAVATARTFSGDLDLQDTGLTILTHLRGVLVNVSVGSPFTNEILQYSGNPAIGYVNAQHLSATAVLGSSAGTASFNSSQIGTNIEVTTVALTTAAGATEQLTVLSNYFTSITNWIPFIQLKSSTTGRARVLGYTRTGGSVIFTIQNDHPTDAFNGTLQLNAFGF